MKNFICVLALALGATACRTATVASVPKPEVEPCVVAPSALVARIPNGVEGAVRDLGFLAFTGQLRGRVLGCGDVPLQGVVVGAFPAKGHFTAWLAMTTDETGFFCTSVNVSLARPDDGVYLVAIPHCDYTVLDHCREAPGAQTLGSFHQYPGEVIEVVFRLPYRQSDVGTWSRGVARANCDHQPRIH